MPPTGKAGYLVGFAREIGLRTITWAELAGWQRAAKEPLTAQEARAIMAIADTYKAALAEFDGKSVSAPYAPKDMTENAVRNALRGRKR